MLTRNAFLRFCLSLPLGAVAARAAAANAVKASHLAVAVPRNHAHDDGRTISIEYLRVGIFDPHVPTVFVVGDGQQFYIRDDILPDFRDLFGPGVNIIGIPGRGFSASLLEELAGKGAPDWRLAYELLQYRQWTADIDAVRRAVLGDDGRILLYGVSGGGQLAHEYMAGYGAHVVRCYTESAVFPTLEAEIGLQHDRFWDEISADERSDLQIALKARPDQRDFYAQLLQRQNFFVNEAGFAAARRDLILAIRNNDAAKLRAAANAYQVDALNHMMATPAALPIRVREYEFVAPLLDSVDRNSDAFLPDILDSAMWARPLLDLQRRGDIALPTVNLATLNALQAEVLVVAGRYDHTCDYRSQIALAAHYPNHVLMLLADDHQMHRLKQLPGARAALLQAWISGFDDAAFRRAVAALDGLRWREA